jgi:hypothetical protein
LDTFFFSFSAHTIAGTQPTAGVEHYTRGVFVYNRYTSAHIYNNIRVDFVFFHYIYDIYIYIIVARWSSYAKSLKSAAEVHNNIVIVQQLYRLYARLSLYYLMNYILNGYRVSHSALEK